MINNNLLNSVTTNDIGDLSSSSNSGDNNNVNGIASSCTNAAISMNINNSCNQLLNSNESIPRKQDIQTDIRMNKGRFRLVRKRGRSEVWNLFGQVIDTLTGSRLPYVACYACKVLYTVYS